MNESNILKIKNIVPEKEKTESHKKILSENADERDRGRYSVKIINHFADLYPGEEKELVYMHPEIMESNKRLRSIKPDELVDVVYIDRRGRKVQDKWSFYEYLRRIGFESEGEKTPFDQYQKTMEKINDIRGMLKGSHRQALQKRNSVATSLDKKYAKQGKKVREGQLKSQLKEDPYFCKMIEKSGFMHPQDLSLLHDYLDATDVLLELESENGEYVYLAVQRTLSTNYTYCRRKKKKVNEHPIWFIPEYPERNPVLRFVLREKQEEYFTEGGEAMIDFGKEIEQKTADQKTMQVLEEALKTVEYNIQNIDSIKEEDVRQRHVKYFEKYRKALNMMIENVKKDQIIKVDNDTSKQIIEDHVPSDYRSEEFKDLINSGDILKITGIEKEDDIEKIHINFLKNNNFSFVLHRVNKTKKEVSAYNKEISRDPVRDGIINLVGIKNLFKIIEDIEEDDLKDLFKDKYKNKEEAIRFFCIYQLLVSMKNKLGEYVGFLDIPELKKFNKEINNVFDCFCAEKGLKSKQIRNFLKEYK